jgi:hypothetical protein
MTARTEVWRPRAGRDRGTWGRKTVEQRSGADLVAIPGPAALDSLPEEGSA